MGEFFVQVEGFDDGDDVVTVPTTTDNPVIWINSDGTIYSITPMRGSRE